MEFLTTSSDSEDLEDDGELLMVGLRLCEICNWDIHTFQVLWIVSHLVACWNCYILSTLVVLTRLRYSVWTLKDSTTTIASSEQGGRCIRTEQLHLFWKLGEETRRQTRRRISNSPHTRVTII